MPAEDRRSALLVVDLQRAFDPPAHLIAAIGTLLPIMPSVATLELHDETRVPFREQLNWSPPADDACLVRAGRTFVKHGYLPPPTLIDHLRALVVERVYVCGLQAETCVLAAGFALFDAGMHPILLASLVAGSSLDRSGELGVRLWRHHFRHVIEDHTRLLR
jgi:nicotinamidase-related amidase